MDAIEQAPTSNSPTTRSRGIWVRGLSMLFFMLALSVAQTVLNALTVVQFFWMLISGDRSHPLARFGAQLAEWIADVVRFQTGATDERPMPWSDWPAANRTHPADPAI